MPNQTGGDFCGGLPAAEKQLLSGRVSNQRHEHHDLTGSDTSHLSNARAVRQAAVPPGDIRHGWHPNVTPK
jgi:hypothetical protein